MKERENQADSATKYFDCPLGGPALLRFHFAEAPFDWIKIRRILRQISQARAHRFDCLAHANDFVSRKIVHDDGIVASERRGQSRASDLRRTTAYEGYLRREETITTILALAKDSTAIKQIVRKTGHSRNRVRQVLRGDRGDVFRARQGSLDAHLPLLDAQWAVGCRNGAKLWRRLKLAGFRGSLRVVSEWATRRRRSEKASDQQLQKVPSARTIARLMTSARDHMSKPDTIGSCFRQRPLDLRRKRSDTTRLQRNSIPRLEPRTAHSKVGEKASAFLAGTPTT